jgi:hypothetical protein
MIGADGSKTVLQKSLSGQLRAPLLDWVSIPLMQRRQVGDF